MEYWPKFRLHIDVCMPIHVDARRCTLTFCLIHGKANKKLRMNKPAQTTDAELFAIVAKLRLRNNLISNITADAIEAKIAKGMKRIKREEESHRRTNDSMTRMRAIAELRLSGLSYATM